MGHVRQPAHRLPLPVLFLLLLSSCRHLTSVVNASAIASSTRAPRRSEDDADLMDCHVSATTVETITAPANVIESASAATVSESTSVSGNPVIQLFSYIKSTMVNFKNGLAQMNTDHKRCNSIRSKQTAHAKSLSTKRPRGILGLQTGGISYEEYDFLKKGLVDRNKLLAVTVVMLCLPNYFVYYLWSFPDMMPSPFLTKKEGREISRERNHAVLSTLLDMERGARVAPWSSKLNPFGKKSTERAMERLTNFSNTACDLFALNNAVGPSGGKLILQSMKDQLYSKIEPTKQQCMLTKKYFPKLILKGLGKVISADPINKGSSPFGLGPMKHIEYVTMADEFLVQQNIDLESIPPTLLEEACSARLIGGPGWSDEERREGIRTWLEGVEIEPKIAKERDGLHFNANLARAALMCYNAVDATRDARSDSRMARMMYQGQVVKSQGAASTGSGSP